MDGKLQLKHVFAVVYRARPFLLLQLQLPVSKRNWSSLTD